MNLGSRAVLISKEIVKLQDHTKHHQAYVNGLNAAEKSYASAPSVAFCLRTDCAPGSTEIQWWCVSSFNPT